MRAILTFHGIDDTGTVLSFPTLAFQRLLQALDARSIPVLSFDRLLQAERGVTLTFDDGMRSIRDHALPVLREFGATAHLFLTTGHVGRDNRWPSQPATAPRFEMLGWPDVEACVRGGMAVESHTASHPDLRSLDDAGITEELRAADDDIERRLGRRPELMAYPYGFVDERVRAIAARRYRGCFTTRMGLLPRHFDAGMIPRIDAYYLRSPLLHRDPLAPLARAYYRLRGVLRTVRGTQ